MLSPKSNRSTNATFAKQKVGCNFRQMPTLFHLDMHGRLQLAIRKSHTNRAAKVTERALAASVPPRVKPNGDRV